MGTVSMASIVGMGFSLAIALGIPLILFVLLRWRIGASYSCFFIGAATFLVFAMVLEQVLHLAVQALTGNLLQTNILFYAVYGGLAAGLFEETGRFLAMKFMIGKKLNRENALMYGAGHGGIEAILLLGITEVSNLITSMSINSGQFEAVLANLDEAARAATIASISPLWTMPSYQFYMAGIERISAIMLHIGLSLLIYKAVKTKNMRFYGIAVFLHFFVNAATVLLSTAAPILVVEAVLMAGVIGIGVWVYRTCWAEQMEAE